MCSSGSIKSCGGATAVFDCSRRFEAGKIASLPARVSRLKAPTHSAHLHALLLRCRHRHHAARQPAADSGPEAGANTQAQGQAWGPGSGHLRQVCRGVAVVRFLVGGRNDRVGSIQAGQRDACDSPGNLLWQPWPLGM